MSIVPITNKAFPNVYVNYLTEDFHFNQVWEEWQDVLVFVFSGCVIQLEVEYWWKKFLPHEDVQQNIDGQIGVVGPSMNIDIYIGSLTMNNCCCYMGSGRMKSDVTGTTKHAQTYTPTLVVRDYSHTFSHEWGEEDLSWIGPYRQLWWTDILSSASVQDPSGGSSAFSLACESTMKNDTTSINCFLNLHLKVKMIV